MKVKIIENATGEVVKEIPLGNVSEDKAERLVLAIMGQTNLKDFTVIRDDETENKQ